jgi:triosephosphate isomerase (TIM)
MKLKLPVIIINFKLYKEATGEGAVKLARICEDVSKKYETDIIVSPEISDIGRVARKVKIPVFAQHIDPIEHGKFTGHVSALSVKKEGAKGTLINHSEMKLELDEIKKCVQLAKKYGLISVVCSDSLSKSVKIAKFNPDFIAFEDPDLIGTGKPISKVEPKKVKEFVKIVSKANPKIVPICGAGISEGEDIKIAIMLGTKGVLLASAFVESRNPRKVLIDMANAIK